MWVSVSSTCVALRRRRGSRRPAGRSHRGADQAELPPELADCAGAPDACQLRFGGRRRVGGENVDAGHHVGTVECADGPNSAR